MAVSPEERAAENGAGTLAAQRRVLRRPRLPRLRDTLAIIVEPIFVLCGAKEGSVSTLRACERLRSEYHLAVPPGNYETAAAPAREDSPLGVTDRARPMPDADAHDLRSTEEPAAFRVRSGSPSSPSRSPSAETAHGDPAPKEARRPKGTAKGKRPKSKKAKKRQSNRATSTASAVLPKRAMKLFQKRMRLKSVEKGAKPRMPYLFGKHRVAVVDVPMPHRVLG
eukprot:scaffold2191_cov254-Pinguiococcus_pyrenoidosus.AAC.16